MIVSKFTDIRTNLKSYCDKVYDKGETAVIARKDDKNAVLISERNYSNMLKKASATAQNTKT